MAVPASLQALAGKLGVPSPERSPVKMEHASPPPPSIEDTHGVLEDGEINEQQSAAATFRGEPLRTVEYLLLEDRFKKLERQHSELQDLASAYSEVIRGFSPTGGQTVSIDQLQAEAGHDGLRAKALEADMLRPLIREAGGFQALVSQTDRMRTLISKAGGLRELEQFVSDLRTMRDTLDELKGAQGLVNLGSEVQDLLKSKRSYTELQSEVLGPIGLKVKAARYDKLMKAFADVQFVTSFQQPPAGCAAMNPDRARLISATPLEDDPDRDLYEAPPPTAQPHSKTGSNNTPLGGPQEHAAAHRANQAGSSSILKRKGSENTTSSVSAKRPRVDLGRDSIMGQALSPTTVKPSVGRASGQSNVMGIKTGTTGFEKTRAQSTGGKGEETVAGCAVSLPQMQTALAPLKMPDWMRSDVRFGEVGFTSTLGARFTSAPSARTPGSSSTPPSENGELRAGIRSDPVRLPANKPSLPPSFSSVNPENGIGGSLRWGSIPAAFRLSVLKESFKYPVALWVGSADGCITWDACQSYDLKRTAEIPEKLLLFLLGELAKHINPENASTYKEMAPSGNTCIARYVVDGHRSSGLPQERRACQTCNSALVGSARPCALLQDISGIRTIVFQPLREKFRDDKRWMDGGYWMQEAR